MKKTIAAPMGAGPRLTAERFCASQWLSVTALCLACSCMMTLMSTFASARVGAGGIEMLDLVSGFFNILYVFAAGAAMVFLWQLRASAARDRFKKAAAGCLAAGLVLLVTSLFLAVFYFSAYSIFSGLKAEEIAEMEISREYIDQMWAMLPYFILSLGCTILEGVSFLVFRSALRRLAEMTVGKSASPGFFTGCASVAALACGFILLRVFLDAAMGGGAVRTVFVLLSGVPNAGVFAGMMLLAQKTASALRGE